MNTLVDGDLFIETGKRGGRNSFGIKVSLGLDVSILCLRDFPGGAVVKNPPANAGNTGLSLVQEDPTCCRAARPMRHNY